MARLIFLCCLALGTLPAYASPPAGELIRTCEAAIAADYRTQDAAMCDWYVAPCGVCGKDGPPPREWCLPPELKDAALAQLVGDELHKAPELLGKPAPDAVKAVLRTRFPCPH